jgi:dTDP-4-dehydrorhamnose 3,5-epimerase
MNSNFNGVIFSKLAKREDDRGWLFELFRDDELTTEQQPVMSYASWTKTGVTRGPHEHRDQTDLFCFVGPGDFKLSLWEKSPADADWKPDPKKEEYIVGESNPVAVLVPPGVVHAYTNISDHTGMVFNAPNQLFAGPGKRYPIDEIRHEGSKIYKC